MTKKVIGVLLSAVLLMVNCSTAQNKISTKQKEVTEIAIYRIAEEKNPQIDFLLTDFRNEVSKLKGYKDYLTLQDKNSPNIYIDILHWENIEDALNASEIVKDGNIYKPFTSSIDSLIAYGEFYQYKSFYKSKKENTMENKITEVVIYQLKSDKVEGYETIANATNEFLNKQKGFISRKIMQDHKDKTIFMDIVEWKNISDAQSAMEVSQKEASLMPFFEATEKVVSFSHYNFFK